MSTVTVAIPLMEAGYVLDLAGDVEVWRHPQTNRMLDATIAEMLTPEQLSRWIADGSRFHPATGPAHPFPPQGSRKSN